MAWPDGKITFEEGTPAAPIRQPARAPEELTVLQTLVLDGWQPVALNRLLKAHRMERSKLLYLDQQIIAAEAKAQGLSKATGRRRVSLVIRYKKGCSTCDPDALWKSGLDALRRCGLLKNDDRLSVELGPVTYEAAPRRGLLVILEDLDP